MVRFPSKFFFISVCSFTVLMGVFCSSSVVAQNERTDSLTVESVPDSLLEGIKFYFKSPKRTFSSLKGLQIPKLYAVLGAASTQTVTWDSVSTYYISRKYNGREIQPMLIADFNSYVGLKREIQKKELRKALIEEGKRQEQQQRGLLDFSIKVPGGENSAFTTIFGKPEVNLRVNGSANMNVGASIQNVEDPALSPTEQKRVDPTFNQNLQLNIQGTIGDKLTIATDWDTERQFDFDNRLKIEYQGYEDEIIKQVQLGNVSMETGNSLIRGGGSLFGIKSVAELGPLRLTTVVSQQQGESKTQTISGGSQETAFGLRPSEYEDDRHFFLDFNNRQEYEDNVSNPQLNQVTYQVSVLNVWIQDTKSNGQDPDAIRAYAFVQLGVVQDADGSYSFPSNENDAFDDELLESLRTESSINPDDFNVPGLVSQQGYFTKLEAGRDYTFDEASGFISLNRRVGNEATLAISYSYIDPRTQETVEVGDVIPRSTGFNYLKLLRPYNLTPDNIAWPLTMRNVYSLGVSGMSPEDLNFRFELTRGNIPQDRFDGSSSTLLQDLGLDRTDSEGALQPDNRLDFNGGTFNPNTGRIIFPYLEPFGDRIRELAQTNADINEGFIFEELYTQKQTEAARNESDRFYRISGKSSGGVSGSFFLGFGLVEGSVKVRANGVELTPGTDYEVDYSIGSITVLNDRYLAKGQNITVEFENNQLSIIGQKNFTGVRAEYEINKDIFVGGTFFRLKEEPLSDKIRIGNEPINNTIIGLDAKANFDTPWLTQFIDRLPLLQTKEPSNIKFSGEFAQLRPGVAQTKAVQDAIDRNELFRDEENGLVFIDDFEGSKYSIPFLNAGRWHLPTAPAAIPGYGPDETYFASPFSIVPASDIISKIDRSDLRAQFAWYTIPRNITSILGTSEVTPESQTVFLRDVFEGRETNNPQDEIITTLDIFYNPTERGPYNYNPNLRDVLENRPEDMWGGMTATLPSGQEDLSLNNIEFLEFWVQAILPDGQTPTAQDLVDYDGKIYIDLGIISEDLIPNFRLNTEDGIGQALDDLVSDSQDNPRSLVPLNNQTPLGEFSNENRQFEDVGLDGVPSVVGIDQFKTEQFLFRDFVDTMRVQYGEESEKFQRILEDPSNDDYIFYRESKVADLKIHERFHRLRGYYEGNTPVSGGEKQAISLRPETEGLISASSVELNNSYYQYEIDFNPADRPTLEPNAGNRFIVDKVGNNTQTGDWFLVRVPVTEFTRSVGEISNFQNISYIRFWMSGYSKPFTMRFATFEFVGSQWQDVNNITEAQNSTADFKVSTVNIEENASRVPIPYRQPFGSIRAINRSAQVQSLANEQSLVLKVDNLLEGEIQMVKRIYPNNLNLLNYSNLRMFVHGEGYENRGDAELVIRMGNDLNNDFYEYRQPVSPTDPDYPFAEFNRNQAGSLEDDADQVWLYDENSVNILISAFNVLKQERDRVGADQVTLYEGSSMLENAVPGAVIAIKGNPSLDRVSELGIGIKNPFNSADVNTAGVPNLSAEFWVNELRVSGFDNEKGWAANAKTSFKLADFATVNANFTQQTNGFGELESRLGSRRVSDLQGYDFNTTVNLHRLVPARYGWTFPVSFSTRKSIDTPKFLPDQGDIRLSDFIDSVELIDDGTTEREKQDIINAKISDVQSINESYSINLSNISKVNSKSKLAQYTLDKTRISYVYNEGFARNPQLRFQNTWSYNTAINYNLTFRNVKLLRPFKFTEDVPIAKVLSEIRLGYMPSSITASAALARNYEERRRRILGSDVTQPLQQTHSFTQRSNFGFNYNFTPNIITSFRSATNFDFSSIGVQDANRTGVDSTSFNVSPTFEVIGGILSDSLVARRSSYQETYTARWTPRLQNIPAINWLTYTANYGGGFSWTNSPRGSGQGAQIGNSFRLDNTFKIDLDKILGGIDFIAEARKKDTELTRERRQAKAAAQRQRNNPNSNGASESVDNGLNITDKLTYFGRKLALGLVSMKTVDFAYQKNKTAGQAGYRGASQFFYAFNDASNSSFSPPLGYRLGITESISRNQLVDNPSSANSLNLNLNNTYSDNLTLGTRLNFFDNFSIDLNWATRWDERNTENISIGVDNSITSNLSSSGDISSTVWAFGSGYESFFKKQLQTAFDDLNGNIISDEGGNQDGRTVLNSITLQDDFRTSYLGSNTGAVGRKNFTPIPKPNWRITWTGLEKMIPFIGDKMTRATLSHSYSGNYRLGWKFDPNAGADRNQPLGGGFTIQDERNIYDPTSVNIERRFTPFIQINITWASRLRTEFGYDRSNITSLALSSNTVTERKSEAFKASMNYTFRRLKLPFFEQLKNNVDLTLNGSYGNDSNQNFILANDLIRAFNNFTQLGDDVDQYEFNPQSETGQVRINSSLVIGYRFSSTINSNFEYTYTRVIPNGSSIPPRTNQEIRFNIRIAIRSR